MERGGGGRGRGRGGYQGYGSGRSATGYDGGWAAGHVGNNGSGGGGPGAAEQTDWSSPRKEFNSARGSSVDNWRRNARGSHEEDDGWRNVSQVYSESDKSLLVVGFKKK